MNDASPSDIKNPNEPTIPQSQTNMSPLDLRVDWWSSWSDWLGVAAILIGGILFFITAFGWGFSWKAGKLKDEALGKYKADSAVEVARLKNEAAQARLELARIDPLNLPIRSMTAEVFLIVRGEFFDWYFAATPFSIGKASSSVSIYDKEGALVTMRCTAFESTEYMATVSGAVSKVVGRTFSMSFVWPSSDWMDAQDVHRNWVERNNASPAMLDKELIAAGISIPPSKGDLQIEMASCVVTINGSIQRKFVPPKIAKTGEIICAPQTQKQTK
jgi:hypothetical protein